MRTCDCLYDLVQWRDICTDDSQCELFVNDHPGYPVDAFEYLTDSDFDTGQKVWDKIQKRAILQLNLDLTTKLAEEGKYNVRNIIEDMSTGYWQQPHVLMDVATTLSILAIDNRHSDNLSTYVSSVDLYSDAAVSSSIFIYNLDTGVLLDTINFTSAAAGFFSVEIGREYQGRIIGVAYDQSAVRSNATTQRGFEYYQELCQQCPCKLNHTFMKARCATLPIGEDVIEGNLDYQSCNVSGMIVYFSCLCSLEPFICRSKGKLAMILWYALGMQLSLEIVASKRVNEVTLALDNFASYNHEQYKKSLKAFVNGVKIKDLVCVECLSPAYKTTFHP